MWVTVPQIRSWWYLINPRAADNVLDLTKGDEVDQNSLYNITDSEFADWSYEDVPPQEIGKLYLTQNP